MRITSVNVTVTNPGRNYVLVKVMTSEPGLYGVGDGTLNGRELAVAKTIEEYLAPLVVGRDPSDVTDIWQLLYRSGYWRGGPVLMSAISAIDLALWDIRGKMVNRPVWWLLGGKVRDRVLCYGHARGPNLGLLREAVHRLAAAGYEAIRIQGIVDTAKLPETYGIGSIQASPPHVEQWDAEAYLRQTPKMFELVREWIGEDMRLLHDVHHRLMPIQAARLAKDLEPYRPFFLEDPVHPEFVHQLDVVRNASTVPLALGEIIHTRWQMHEVVKRGLIDYIRSGIIHVGGISEGQRLAHLAETTGTRTAWHGPPDVSLVGHAANFHLDISSPNFGIQEWVEPPEQVREVIEGGPVCESGHLVMDLNRPGLGCDFDEEKAKKFPYERRYLPTVRLGDGAVGDW